MRKYPAPSHTNYVIALIAGWGSIACALIFGGPGFLTTAVGALIIARIELAELRRETRR